MPIKSLYSSCAFYFCAYLSESALTFYLYLYLCLHLAGSAVGERGFRCATSKGDPTKVLFGSLAHRLPASIKQ